MVISTSVLTYLLLRTMHMNDLSVTVCILIKSCKEWFYVGKKVVTLFIHEKAVTRPSRYTYALHASRTGTK